MNVILESVVTCPTCEADSSERMPEDASQFFWECPVCEAVARPKPGDFCVYCTYGTVPCPPIQEGGG